nr:carboxymuconolactone decarboxylase family protein [Desulfobulbaceae bacterium]
MSDLPKNYKWMMTNFEKVVSAHQELGKALYDAGPLDKKTAQLIKLAAAAATGSEGGVHSHSKRALDAGASKEEIYHALILLSSSVGFSNAAAAVSWARDILEA